MWSQSGCAKGDALQLAAAALRVVVREEREISGR
jgi:hypothetical protein